MEMNHIVLDTDNMSLKEIDTLMQKLRKIRNRKEELHARKRNIWELIANMKENQMTLVSRYTGEVFDPDDWAVYDETTCSFYPEEEEKNGNTDR